MKLPTITHQQALVLSIIKPEKISGQDIRRKLDSANQKLEGPAFYQFMKRLEDNKFISGKYKEFLLEKQRIKERTYTITKKGSVALSKTFSFYSNLDESNQSPSS